MDLDLSRSWVFVHRHHRESPSGAHRRLAYCLTEVVGGALCAFSFSPSLSDISDSSSSCFWVWVCA